MELDPAPSPGTGSETHSPEQKVGTDRHAVLQRSRYPLNSKKLTVAHLRALAEAIGLPTLGSADQLRQCIEGKLQTERDDPNVVVIVRDVEQILSLADSEGEFARTPPLRRGPSLRRDSGTARELQEVSEQLHKAEREIESARTKDLRQAQEIAELSDARELLEQHAKELSDQVTSLTKQLHESKAKLRDNWKTSCEHLAEQDAVVAEKDAEIADLKQRLNELIGDRRDEREGRTSHHGAALHTYTQVTVMSYQ